MSRYYYNQQDLRWGKKLYTSTNNKSQTISSSGCGPTSAAMVISALSTEVITPDRMADLFVKNGFRTPADGTSWSAFNWIGKNWGIRMEQTSNLDKAIACLNKGGMVIASTYNGLFSTGGHIIVLSYMKDANTIVAYDPYLYNGKFNLYNRKGKVTVSGVDCLVSVDNFRAYAGAGQYWCYTPDLVIEGHIQNIGWQDIRYPGQHIGTTGQALRLEAIKITDNLNIGLQYRVHIQDIGWMDWKRAGEVAGTVGQSRRIEAIEFKANPGVVLKAKEHLQDKGWMPEKVGNPITIGTTGQSRRLEAFRLNF